MYEEKDDSISWGELAQLTHATQVEQFNFCLCEEQEQFPYEDCPQQCELCGRNDRGDLLDGMCRQCNPDSHEWEERVGLTHAEQKEKFGWCICEGTNGEGQLAEDCPKS